MSTSHFAPPGILFLFGFAALVASACTTTIEGAPAEDEVADGGTGAPSTGVPGQGGTTGSDATSTGGSVSPPAGGATGAGPGAGLGGSTTTTGGGGPTVGGTAGTTSVGTGGVGTGGVGTGGVGTGGVGTGGVGTGGVSGGNLGGAGSGTAGTAASDFASVRSIIATRCATATCHGGRRNPNLSTASLLTTLTGTAVQKCGSDHLVTPGDPTNSAILELVNGQCGTLLMPDTCRTAPCLPAAETAVITAWITSGAPG